MACAPEGCLQVAVYFFPRFCWNIHFWVPSPCFPLSPHRCLGSSLSGEPVRLGSVLTECRPGEECTTPAWIWLKDACPSPSGSSCFCYEDCGSKTVTLGDSCSLALRPYGLKGSFQETKNISLFVKGRRGHPDTLWLFAKEAEFLWEGLQFSPPLVYLWSWWRGKDGEWMKFTECSQTTFYVTCSSTSLSC